MRRLWPLALVACGGSSTTTLLVVEGDAAAPDAQVVYVYPDAAPVEDAGACPKPEAVADHCYLAPGECGDGGRPVHCLATGMVSLPHDENDAVIEACERTALSDSGFAADYCCPPKTCIRARRSDCSECDGRKAMFCFDVDHVVCR